MALYATIHSSNHAGQSPSTRAKHRPFPTTNHVSSKHSPLSDNEARLSDTSLSFTHRALLVTHHFLSPFTQSLVPIAQSYSMEPTPLSNTAPHPVMENTRRIWSAAAGFGDFDADSHFHRIHRLRRQPNQTTTTPTTRFFVFYYALCTLNYLFLVLRPQSFRLLPKHLQDFKQRRFQVIRGRRQIRRRFQPKIQAAQEIFGI
jgi:hypothetical protein